MIRGTTPSHIFQLPFNTDTLKEIRISYAQDDIVIVEKTTEDCTLEADTITVKLTQEETLKFIHGKTAKIQLKVKLLDGNTLATYPLRVDVGEILNEEVLE